MTKARYTFSLLLLILLPGILTAQLDTIHLDASETSGTIGDTVCVEVTVTNFVEITAFQFPILWDPTYMEFAEVKNEHPAINFTPLSFGVNNIDKGLLNVVHFDQTLEGYTLADGSVLFEICFEITGPPGADNPVLFQDAPILTEFIRNNFQMPHKRTDGYVTIEGPSEPSWVISHCTSRPDSATGLIYAEFYGSVQGSRFEWTHIDSMPFSGAKSIDQSGQSIEVKTLISGSYNIQLFDDADELLLNDTIEIGSNGPFTAQFTHSDPYCTEDNDGRYGIESRSGGIAPYFYRWTGYNFLYDELTDLSNGTYTATVKDLGGCVIRDTVELFTPPILAEGEVTQISCRDSSDGEINWYFHGGSPYSGNRYNIFLNDSFVARDSSLALSGLSPDTLNLRISDSLGCMIDSTVIFHRGRIHSFDSVAYRSTNCWNTNDGFILLEISTDGPNYPPYEATVSQNISGFTIEDGLFQATGLGDGTYSIEITDQGPGSCPIDTSITLGRPDTIGIELVKSLDDDCTNISTGYLEVTANGGSVSDSSDYTYLWNNGMNGPINDSIISGQYSVTVSDTLGCENTASYMVGNDEGPTIDTVISRDVLCHGDSSGKAEVHYSPGDTSEISVMWSNGSSDTINSNLRPGNYSLTISDANGCMAFASVEIDEPDSLSYTVTTEPEVDSMMNGSIDLQISGGTPPYSVIWILDSMQIGPPFPSDSLRAGTYEFHITDDNGCNIWDSVLVDNMTTYIERPDEDRAWKIYPNPAEHTIQLQCTDCTRPLLSWKLIDLQGSLLRQKEFIDDARFKVQIPIGDLPNGMHLLQWTLKDGTIISGKWIKN